VVWLRVQWTPERELPSRKTTDSKKAQSRRFIDAAREAGASEDEAVFRENLKRLAQHKPKEDREPQK
jgi:hypothetical protein